MCIYGIELLPDNISQCRANLLEILADYLQISEEDDLYQAASFVLSRNLVHGDALKMLTAEGQPITFAEWAYVGKGKFQRRDFSLKSLTQMSSFRKEMPVDKNTGMSQAELFAQMGSHEVFTPIKPDYLPMTIAEIATIGRNKSTVTAS
jgi:hypothetical protein